MLDSDEEEKHQLTPAPKEQRAGVEPIERSIAKKEDGAFAKYTRRPEEQRAQDQASLGAGSAAAAAKEKNCYSSDDNCA